jgi:hypothetical protein
VLGVEILGTIRIIFILGHPSFVGYRHGHLATSVMCPFHLHCLPARKPRGQRVVDAYFSRDHFDDCETCCPLIALPSDVMRGSDEMKGAYREVLEKLLEIFMDDLDEPQRRERALALAALCVGSIVTPKCVDDPALADDLRRAAHRQALRIGGWTAPTSRRQRKKPQSGRSPNRLVPLMSPREPHRRAGDD